METIFLTATPEEKGRRLDQFLAEQLEELTRSAAQRLAEEEHVLLNGKPLKKNYKMTGCETLEVHLPDPEPIDAVPQNIPLDIAYEDEDLLVINKPKGMVVHPAPGNPDGTVVNAVLYHCGESLSGIGSFIQHHKFLLFMSLYFIKQTNGRVSCKLQKTLPKSSLI